MRTIAILRVVLILATLIGATVIGVSTPASAQPCRPPRCDQDPPPDPEPGPPPAPPTTKNVVVEIPSKQQQPITAYDAQHVHTVLHVGREIDLASGQVRRAWVTRDYDVRNDWAFQGWHVRVREQLLNSVGQLLQLNEEHVIGVTPTFFDSINSHVELRYTDDISPQLADQITSFAPEDHFSN